MSDNDLIRRDQVLEWLAEEADRCDDAAKWGGARKYVADCKAAAYALRNAKRVIEKMPAATETQTPAARDVLTERARQVSGDGWTSEHDDQWRNGELPRAARAYLLAAHVPDGVRVMFRARPPSHWPWPRDWWKLTERRRDLVKAAALVVTEIDRIDRAAILRDTEIVQEGGE